MSDERRPRARGAGSSRPRASRSEIAELSRELGELAREAPARLAERVASLSIREQAELALRLPDPERLELLLHAPKPMRLVRSLPDAELYLTVRQVGPSDALPLLSLASADQIQHLIDLESWRKDRFDANRSGAWVTVLLESGEPTLRRFLRNADDDLLALLLQQWLRLEQIELDDTPPVHGPGESEVGDETGFVSPDGYHRFSPTIAEHGPAVGRLLQVFFTDQPDRYQQTLWSALWELPSELEERALHWRQSRLEEHGFPPWEEALAVYAPPTGGAEPGRPAEDAASDRPAAPGNPLRVLADRGLLLPAVDGLDENRREQVLHEIILLANRLLVADAADPGDPRVHRVALEKAAGYVEIALALRGVTQPGNATEVLERIPVLELFREGYSPVAELQRRSRRLVRGGWAAAHARALELLDDPVRSRVAGLLEPRPQYLDLSGSADDLGRRDFRSLDEVRETAAALELAEVIGGLFVERLGLDIDRLLRDTVAGRAEPPRLSTLLLTLLAWQSARDEMRHDPLPPEVISVFLRNIASRRTASPDAPSRAMDALVGRLGETLDLGHRELEVLRAFGRAALEQLASECSSLDPGTPIDPRYVTCLLIEP